MERKETEKNRLRGKPSTVDLLKRARKRIEDPNDWWPGTKEARKGRRCMAMALGSAFVQVRVVDDLATNFLSNAISGELFAPFNDSHTHPQVLAAFDKAIELAEAAQ